MRLNLFSCLVPGLALGLTLVGHTDEEVTDRQVGGPYETIHGPLQAKVPRRARAASAPGLRSARDSAYDGLSSCDPLANIFVINVAGPVGAPRRASAMAELERAGISQYKILNAVTPQEFSYPEIIEAGETNRRKDGHDKIGRGEAALALSHKKVYNRIVEENRSCALVFEDDFRLLEPSVFKDRISRVQLPAEYDVIKLEYGLYKGFHSVPFYPATPQSVVPAMWPGCCTSGYLVSNAGARLLLAANTPLWINADGNMHPAHIRNSAAAARLPVKSFHFSPPLSWQTDEFDQGGTETT